MKYRKYFMKAARRQYPQEANEIIVDTDRNYRRISKDVSFAARSSNPIDRRLDFAAYFLAFIQALERKGTGYLQIRKLCIEITTDYVRPKNAFQRWWKKLPAKLVHTAFAQWLVHVLKRKVSAKGHEDGFRACITTDPDETFGLGYGVDILECGICKLFAKHQADQYNTILCEVDEITSSLAGLEMIRRGTIAKGFGKCDFRYKRTR